MFPTRKRISKRDVIIAAATVAAVVVGGIATTQLFGASSLGGARAATVAAVDGTWSDAQLTSGQTNAWVTKATNDLAQRFTDMDIYANRQAAPQIRVKDDGSWLAVDIYVLGEEDSNGNAPDAGDPTIVVGDTGDPVDPSVVTDVPLATVSPPVTVPVATVQAFNRYSLVTALYGLDNSDSAKPGFTNPQTAVFQGDHEMLITDNFDAIDDTTKAITVDAAGIVRADYIDGEYIGQNSLPDAGPWTSPANECTGAQSMLILAKIVEQLECALAKDGQDGRFLTCMSSVVALSIWNQAGGHLCLNAAS